MAAVPTFMSSRNGTAAHGFDAGREGDWRQEGACRNYNPDWWTPTTVDSDAASWAAYVCLGCPVRRQCDDWAAARPTLCAGSIYAGTYYLSTTKTPRKRVRASHVQPVPRQPPDIRALLDERFGPVAVLEWERAQGGRSSRPRLSTGPFGARANGSESKAS